MLLALWIITCRGPGGYWQRCSFHGRYPVVRAGQSHCGERGTSTLKDQDGSSSAKDAQGVAGSKPQLPELSVDLLALARNRSCHPLVPEQLLLADAANRSYSKGSGKR